MKQTLKGTFFSITAGILLGLSPLLAKTLYSAGSNPYTLVVSRMVFGAAFFAIMHRITGHTSFRIPFQTVWKLLLCSAGFSMSPIFAYSSYLYMNSGLATTVQFLYPALILVGGVLFCHARVSALQVFCCILCIFGVLCFYSGGGFMDPKGLFFALGCAFCYAFYSLFLSASGLFQLPLALLSFWLCCFGSVFASIITLISGQLALPSTGNGWIILLVYVLAMAAASITYQEGVLYIGAQKASMLSAFEPMTSMVIGVLIYKEALTPQILVGFLCILIAVILLNRTPPTMKEHHKNRSDHTHVSNFDS